MKAYEVFSAFKISPTQIYQLQARGTLPKYPRGQPTPDFINKLAKWYEQVRGHLPEAAVNIMDGLE